MLQARLFAYPDAARYRLGVNYQQLPTNAAKAQVYCPFQRDGKMRFDDNYGGDPNYVGSSIKPTKFYQDVKGTNAAALHLHTEHEQWAGEISAYSSEITDADFVQPAALWEVIGREPGHQDRLIDNLVSSVKGVKYPELRKAVYSMCSTSIFEKLRPLHCKSNIESRPFQSRQQGSRVKVAEPYRSSDQRRVRWICFSSIHAALLDFNCFVSR